jgi:glycosyltransferase involved in cell wall biosynthesis
MKKMIYIANARIPTEKAHGLAIMKMCESFVGQGVELELVLPRRLNVVNGDPFDFYKVNKSFVIKKVPVLDLIPWLGRFGFFVETFTFAISSTLYSLTRSVDIFYGRDEVSLSFVSLLNKNVFWESHTSKRKWLVHCLFKRAKGIIVISQGLKNHYLSLGFTGGNILVASSGFDEKIFFANFGKNEARTRVCLPKSKKIVLYTGHLYDWKGTNVLAESSFNFSEGVQFVFVGGTDKDILCFRKKYSSAENIDIISRRPNYEIPFYLKSADILVLPNSGKEDISRFYTSPMKLFEYMASGVPIVASDLPSIREVLNENNSLLVEADNATQLAKGIKRILQDTGFACRISKQAKEDVQKYTWDKRAFIILNFIKDENTF